MFSPAKLFKKIGPGFITGASDDDPSGIATYSQAGATFGYGFLWMALFTTPLMMAVQEMSARIGLTSGRGLMDVMKRHTGRRVVLSLSLLLLAANTLNIGADLAAMAAAAKLVLPGPGWAYLVGFAGLIILLEIRVSYHRYVNLLRWLTLALFTYIAAAFLAGADWTTAILKTLVPSFDFSRESVFMMVAILGTTISPYLFFWQASEEVEEEIEAGRTTVKARQSVGQGEIRRMRRDVASGMVLSNLIMFFIIVTTAATLHAGGTGPITTAADAAEALRPIGGEWSFWLFTLGVIGTGLLAIPVLAGSASYALAEVFHWHEGLGRNFRQAPQFYTTMAAAVACGAALNGLGFSSVTLLLLAAVVNGLVAPVMLWQIMRLARRRDVVGEHASPPAVQVGGWLAFGLMTAAAVTLLFMLL